ncbi:serine protease [Nocardioides sp. MH1]|uniref:trypsin-like serine peptidase n=1 Tax=Nocardioides sp. MH1 TaxID=3242490 RepID=UPI003520C9B8
MHAQKTRTFRKRLVPLATVALTLGAMVGVAQLGANFNSGAAAKPATSSSLQTTAAPSKNFVVNTNKAATKGYWTAARTEHAKAFLPNRTDAQDQSYGTSGLDFTRSRISPQTGNTATPYRATGKLFFTEPGIGDFQCSASVIAKRMIITAAHCLYGNGGFYTNWTFIPGYDGSRPTLAQQRPYGTWTWARGQVPTNWITTNGSLPNATDFAVLVLNDQSVSGSVKSVADVVGKYAFATGHLFDTAVTMLGYPCNFDSCNIMQRVDTSDHRIPPGTSGANAYEYGSDMTGGSSGGPWLENFGIGALPTGGWKVRNTVVAVTSYGYTDSGASEVQGASQLNGDFTTIYNASCAAATGNC